MLPAVIFTVPIKFLEKFSKNKPSKRFQNNYIVYLVNVFDIFLLTLAKDPVDYMLIYMLKVSVYCPYH